MALLEREYKISATPPSEEKNLQRWDTATGAFLDRVQSLLSELDSNELETMTRVLAQVHHEPKASEPKVALAQKLTGQKLSQVEKLRLDIASLVGLFAKRRELLQDSLTASQVAELLGTTRQTPHDRVTKCSLIAVLDKGMWKFPIWQFDPQGPDGVIEGLPPVLRVMSGSNFAKLSWLVSPNSNLNKLTPVEALKQGKLERVIQEAQAIGVW
jgi:hypothetical protein